MHTQFAHTELARAIQRDRLRQAGLDRRGRTPRPRLRLVIGGRATNGDRLVVAIARGS